MPPDLVVADWISKSSALSAVVDRIAHRFFHAGQRENRGREALALEIMHHIVEALIHFTQNVSLRDAAFIEEQLGRVGRHVADLFQLLSDRETFGLGWEENQRNAFVAFHAGAHREYDEVRARAVCD